MTVAHLTVQDPTVFQLNDGPRALRVWTRSLPCTLQKEKQRANCSFRYLTTPHPRGGERYQLKSFAEKSRNEKKGKKEERRKDDRKNEVKKYIYTRGKKLTANYENEE